MKRSFVVLTTATLILLMVFTIHPQVAFADEGTSTPDTPVPTETPSPPEENEVGSETVVAGSNEEETTVEPEAGLAISTELPPTEGVVEETASVSTPEPNETALEQTDDSSTPEPLETTAEQTDSENAESNQPILEALEQASDGTQLVVLDSEGQAEPLASQEAANIIETGDPIWCPDTVTTPQANTNGCTNSWASFDDLLIELEANTNNIFNGPGIIYVAYNYDSNLDNDIDIDGNNLTDLGALTIQGGWDFTTQAVNTTTPFSTFDGDSVSIYNWIANVIIKNIFIDGSGYGLEVQTDGDVALSDVQVVDTVQSDGISVEAGGDVTLMDVNSSSNNYNGATIDSGGNVTVQDSLFENNGSIGVKINATDDIEIANTTATGNFLDGIVAEAGNDVALTNVDSSSNMLNGATIVSDRNVTIANSLFEDNGYFDSSTNTVKGIGLEIEAVGDIEITDTTTTGNFKGGANFSANGNITIAQSIFNSNSAYTTTGVMDGYGFEADAGGNIELTNVFADGNYKYGGSLFSAGNVIVQNNSSFSGNTAGEGLMIEADGTIILDTVTASNNGDTGTILEGDFYVEVSNATFQNNMGMGLEINTTDDIEIANATATGNTKGGANLSADGNITITQSAFSNNATGTSGGYGVEAEAGGDIELTSVFADGNYEYGANLYATGIVVVQSNSSFSNNTTGNGLSIETDGTISLDTTTATDNGSTGAILESNSSVEVSNSIFNTNASTGIEIGATNNIDITSTTVTGNLKDGANFSAVGNIVIKQSIFNSNSGYGFDASAGGNVTANNIFADGNYDYGASIENQGTITINNSSFSNNQGGEGISVDTAGTILFDSVTASNNIFYGAILVSNKDILIKNSSFRNNPGGIYNAGIEIESPGNITLSSVVTSNNGGGGIIIYDSTNILLQNVTSQSNGWDGAYIEAKCAIANVVDGEYNSNGFFGIELSTGRVYLSDTEFNNNSLGSVLQNVYNCPLPVPAPEKNYSPVKPEVPLSWNIISVINSTSHKLNCNSFVGTILVLENGDRVRIPCPIADASTLTRVSPQDLPGAIPNGYGYLSGLNLEIALDGQVLDTLDTAITISFRTDQNPSTLAILYWNGSNWDELSSFGNHGSIIYGSGEILFWNGTSWTDIVPPGEKVIGNVGYMTSGGYFETVLNFPGIFILTEKDNAN